MKNFAEQISESPRMDLHPNLSEVIGPSLTGLRINQKKTQDAKLPTNNSPNVD